MEKNYTKILGIQSNIFIDKRQFILINKQGNQQFQQFNRKTFTRVNFHSIRMKKFQLMFPFPLLNRNIIDQYKQGVITFTFYIQQAGININSKQQQVQFRLNVNIIDNMNMTLLTYQHKEQLFNRLRMEESLKLKQRYPKPKPNQLYQFYMNLNFDDKVGKFMAKFCSIVGFFVDRLAFSQPRSIIPTGNKQKQYDYIQCPGQEIQKYIELISSPTIYRQSQYKHTHNLILILKQKTASVYIEQKKQTKIIDENLIVRLIKEKYKKNQRTQKQQGYDRAQLIISDDIKRYIAYNILRYQPLRQCHKKVIKFVENYIKVVYQPFKDQITLKKIQKRDITIGRMIINIKQLIQYRNAYRRIQFSIIGPGNIFFMANENQQDLVAEITFSIADFKIGWIKKLPEGYMIIRYFQDRLQIVKDFLVRHVLKLPKQTVMETYVNKVNQLCLQLNKLIQKNLAFLQSLMI